MPIGLLIGWLIGQIFITIILINSNSKLISNQPDSFQLARKLLVSLGLFLFWTGISAFIGTIIELIVR